MKILKTRGKNCAHFYKHCICKAKQEIPHYAYRIFHEESVIT